MQAKWPTVPQVKDATPERPRRAWGKVPHEERFNKQRRDLLRAAANLASRRGYHDTRLSDIVAEAGLSKTTFYDHFASKEECFVELYRRVTAAMLRAGIAAAKEHEDGDAYQTVLATLEAITGYVDQNPRLADALRVQVAAAHPTIANERAAHRKRLAELFVTIARRFDSPMTTPNLTTVADVLVHGTFDVLPDLRRKGAVNDRLGTLAELFCRALGLART